MIFVDLETTGLAPAHGARAWSIALVDGAARARTYLVREADRDMARASPQALAVGRYREHFRAADAAPEAAVAQHVAGVVAGEVLAGVNPWFDAAFLLDLLARHGLADPAGKPPWDYHLVDVLAYGAGAVGLAPPWTSGGVARALGVVRDKATAHTALGDALFARDLYRAAAAARRGAGVATTPGLTP